MEVVREDTQIISSETQYIYINSIQINNTLGRLSWRLVFDTEVLWDIIHLTSNSHRPDNDPIFINLDSSIISSLFIFIV